jgi:hypothetical protein
MKYSFIEIHLEKPNHIYCELCDCGPGEDVIKYYAYNVNHGGYSVEHRALSCCLHLGEVVDWREDKEGKGPWTYSRNS